MNPFTIRGVILTINQVKRDLLLDRLDLMCPHGEPRWQTLGLRQVDEPWTRAGHWHIQRLPRSRRCWLCCREPSSRRAVGRLGPGETDGGWGLVVSQVQPLEKENRGGGLGSQEARLRSSLVQNDVELEVALLWQHACRSQSELDEEGWRLRLRNTDASGTRHMLLCREMVQASVLFARRSGEG